jgi:hypothetical protein
VTKKAAVQERLLKYLETSKKMRVSEKVSLEILKNFSGEKLR